MTRETCASNISSNAPSVSFIPCMALHLGFLRKIPLWHLQAFLLKKSYSFRVIPRARVSALAVPAAGNAAGVGSLRRDRELRRNRHGQSPSWSQTLGIIFSLGVAVFSCWSQNCQEYFQRWFFKNSSYLSLKGSFLPGNVCPSSVPARLSHTPLQLLLPVCSLRSAGLRLDDAQFVSALHSLLLPILLFFVSFWNTSLTLFCNTAIFFLRLESYFNV